MAAERRAILRTVLDALHAGRHDEARLLSQPLVSAPDIEARLLHALALGGCGLAAPAAVMLCAIAREKPEAIHPCQDLAGLLVAQKRGADAEPIFRAALALTPDDPRLLLAWGDWLTGQLRAAEAEAALRQALSGRPRDLATMNQLGIVLIALGRTDEGLAMFRDVVALNPANHAGWANLGCALAHEGEFEDALAYYHRAIRIRPEDAQIRLNHSICLLKSGRMTQGWTEHEWRLSLPGHTELPRRLLLPSLGPNTDLSGATVLVTQEEGLGDTLMYLRYAPLLADRGARVLLWVPQSLLRLAQRAEPRATVLAGDVPDPIFTWHCPFISLPRAFAATDDAMGQPIPYLRVDPEAVARMASLLPATPGLRVGLVWGGAPRAADPVAHGIDRRRSIGLAALAPLAALRDVTFVSLQKGPYADELADPPPGLVLHDPMPHIDDMDDTASLVMNLDLVVSVDTAVVHLAGGLGVPTILLDRYDNCWRWLYGREDSDWYPTVRIIRQTRPGAWSDVVARLVEAIRGRRYPLPISTPAASTRAPPSMTLAAAEKGGVSM
ncbi:tetratricopeptide repeat protein [Lichenicoccus sp.]|uniref:tetratricopeptide repeat protein n=1 Tax=Lichenicoccus sp. TaxID=2781899 RepID=UPI003D12D2C9